MYTNHQQISRTLPGLIFFYRVFKDVPTDLYIYQLERGRPWRSSGGEKGHGAREKEGIGSLNVSRRMEGMRQRLGRGDLSFPDHKPHGLHT
jgi:hypothetical protein